MIGRIEPVNQDTTNSTSPAQTTPGRAARRFLLVGVVAALTFGAAACGSDDDDSSTADTATAATVAPATEPPATEPAPTDPPATDPAPTDPPATEPPAETTPADDPALSAIWDELVAAGLTSEQATCVVDAASAEWGSDALVGAGSISDEQLLRLGEITFGCA